MNITVNGSESIQSLQEEFGSRFPYLRIVFYLPKSDALKSSGYGRVVGIQTTLSEFRKDKSPQQLIISPALTVAEVAQKFLEYFGLHALVLRRTGSLWLETTMTAGWTLEEQNRQGESLAADKSA